MTIVPVVAVVGTVVTVLTVLTVGVVAVVGDSVVNVVEVLVLSTTSDTRKQHHIKRFTSQSNKALMMKGSKLSTYIVKKPKNQGIFINNYKQML